MTMTKSTFVVVVENPKEVAAVMHSCSVGTDASDTRYLLQASMMPYVMISMISF